MLRDYTPPQWEFTLVDPNGDAGQYTSVAIDPRTGNPYISYYDAGNGNLRMVNPVGPHNGNCGLEQDWRCEVVKPTDDVGRYSSIAIWADASVWKIGIAYYNDTTDSLEYAEFIEGGSWTFTAIDVGEPLLNIRDGRYASLKFNADGAPRIAYYTWNALGTSALKFAEYVGSGGTCSDPAGNAAALKAGTASAATPRSTWTMRIARTSPTTTAATTCCATRGSSAVAAATAAQATTGSATRLKRWKSQPLPRASLD
jgi:hypothetical protein